MIMQISRLSTKPLNPRYNNVVSRRIVRRFGHRYIERVILKHHGAARLPLNELKISATDTLQPVHHSTTI